jgi:hypothetical protein
LKDVPHIGEGPITDENSLDSKTGAAAVAVRNYMADKRICRSCGGVCFRSEKSCSAFLVGGAFGHPHCAVRKPFLAADKSMASGRGSRRRGEKKNPQGKRGHLPGT